MGDSVTGCPLFSNLAVLDYSFVDHVSVYGHMLGDYDVDWLQLSH